MCNNIIVVVSDREAFRGGMTTGPLQVDRNRNKSKCDSNGKRN